MASWGGGAYQIKLPGEETFTRQVEQALLRDRVAFERTALLDFDLLILATFGSIFKLTCANLVKKSHSKFSFKK